MAADGDTIYRTITVAQVAALLAELGVGGEIEGEDEGDPFLLVETGERDFVAYVTQPAAPSKEAPEPHSRGDRALSAAIAARSDAIAAIVLSATFDGEDFDAEDCARYNARSRFAAIYKSKTGEIIFTWAIPVEGGVSKAFLSGCLAIWIDALKEF